MKKYIKSLLFDAQVANANTAKREQVLVVALMLIMVVVALALM